MPKCFQRILEWLPVYYFSDMKPDLEEFCEQQGFPDFEIQTRGPWGTWGCERAQKGTRFTSVESSNPRCHSPGEQRSALTVPQ